MGFEITFSFHEKLEEGGYDLGTKKTFTKVIGTQDTDVPLEEAANTILHQRARRDVLITDVEIFEFVRKPVTFKESKGGIVLKNRKFDLSSGTVSASQAEETPQQSDGETASLRQMLADMQKQIAGFQQMANNAGQGERRSLLETPDNIIQQRPGRGEVTPDSPPLRMEIFTPDEGAIPHLKARNTPLTVNKAYPILKEQAHGNTLLYTVRNNDGGLTTMTSMFFSPPVMGVPTTGASPEGPQLVYQGQGGSPNDRLLREPVMAQEMTKMPTLRRR